MRKLLLLSVIAATLFVACEKKCHRCTSITISKIVTVPNDLDHMANVSSSIFYACGRTQFKAWDNMTLTTDVIYYDTLSHRDYTYRSTTTYNCVPE